jgi:hypothetical protein
MVLRLIDPPPDALETVRKYVLPAGDTTAHGAHELSTGKPQPIYNSSIQALDEKRLLAAAQLTGWQYILLSGSDSNRIDCVVEVTQAGDGKDKGSPLSPDVRYPAAYGEAINETIVKAEKIAGDYDLRMLRVPSVSLLAVWLHDAVKGDLLFPVPPAPTMLRKQSMFTEGELTEALRPLVNQRYVKG